VEISANGKEWLAVLIFFSSFIFFTLGETVWLERKGWSKIGKSLAFAFITNIFSFGFGFFVIFLVFGVVMAMAWDGSLQKIPAQNYTVGAALIAASLFPFILLALAKRLLLLLFKMSRGKAAWLFSFVSSFLVLAASVCFPILFLYFF